MPPSDWPIILAHKAFQPPPNFPQVLLTLTFVPTLLPFAHDDLTPEFVLHLARLDLSLQQLTFIVQADIKKKVTFSHKFCSRC